MLLVWNLDDATSCVAVKRKFDGLIKNLRTTAIFLRKLFQTHHYNTFKNKIALKDTDLLDPFCSTNDINHSASDS